MKMIWRLAGVLIAGLLAGCWTFTTYTGDYTSNTSLDARADYVYAALPEHSLKQGFTIEHEAFRTGTISILYKFPNTPTFSSAANTLNPYAGPICNGCINNYGQHPFVRIQAKITSTKSDGTKLFLKSRFETYGVPQGVGGVGPFAMVSNGSFERNFVDGLKAKLKDAPPASKPAKTVKPGRGA